MNAQGLSRPHSRKGIIFGASAGVGAALGVRLSQTEDVTFVSRRGIAPEGATGRAVGCDVRDYSAVARIIEATPQHLDYVVSCVGVGYYAPYNRDFSHWWEEILSTNVTGNVNILSAVMRLRPECRQVIVLGSVGARRPSRTPGNQMYRASKAALAVVLDDIRLELRASGSLMKICNLAPGFIEPTDFGRRYYESDPAAKTDLYGKFRGLSPEEVAGVMEWILAGAANIDITEMILRPTAQPD
ncbi:SDR family oxidoreductase [Bradyrhizobium betae]|uniref:SDR family oxidoreductase n=1 Tax=Bradyrhizobium betae TaxID=244734 RepID=UPI003D67F38F